MNLSTETDEGRYGLSTILCGVADASSHRLAFRFLHDGENQAEELTYGELHRRAQAVAARLAAASPAGSHVLVVCPPGLDYIVALFACMHAGMVAVPAFPPQDMHRAAERLVTILKSANISVALGTRAVRQILAQAIGPEHPLSRLPWLVADSDEADATDAALWRPPSSGPRDLALLQFTSGSTSTPRGVMLTQDNLLSNCRAIAQRMRVEPDSHVVSWLPPYHDMGLIGCLMGPALVGAATTLMSPMAFLAKPYRWLSALSRYGGHISGGPDFAYGPCTRRVTDQECETLDLSRWRIAFNGAERVHPNTMREFAERFSPSGFSPSALRPCYGLAEATLCVTLGSEGRISAPYHFEADALKQGLVRLAESEARSVELLGCGTPMPEHRVRVVEHGTGRALPPGRVGEIWVSGPSIGAGIYGDKALSRATFAAELLLSDGHRYLRTGDLGFLHEGELYVVARLKDLIIIRGRNHYPDDIEKAVGQAHPALRLGATVAFMVESAEEERLIVVQELRSSETVDNEAVAAAIREAVARALQLPVHSIMLVPARTIPRTSSGKVQRQKTKSMYEGSTLPGVNLALRTSGAFPRATGSFPKQGEDDLESKVQDVMARHLGQRVVQLDDDFFALGGHSLLATRVMSHLRESLCVDLPLRLIFDAPTPRGLAASLRSVQLHLSVPAIEAIDRDGELPLSYSQERMFFMHVLRPDSAAYNIAGAMQLDGPLDADAVHGALADVVERHEILNAGYRATADGAQQILRSHTAIEVRASDFSGAVNPQQQSDRAASALAVEPFDLQRDPLVRIALHRMGESSHRLILCVHHIVADGWSLEIALHDFVAFYTARRHGVAAELEPLTTQYVDYAAWQREFLSSGRLRAQLDYWTTRLAGAPALLSLPTDRPRPAEPDNDGDLVQISMSTTLVEKLSELGREHGATLFMVMLAAFNVVLSRYSGQVDICVGTPIANR
ncbi:MAG: AMP-binding protein, partial [Nannocystaceae bacterium]|nr:AMP-binding protein [Nannocystaceae bacterium]